MSGKDLEDDLLGIVKLEGTSKGPSGRNSLASSAQKRDLRDYDDIVASPAPFLRKNRPHPGLSPLLLMRSPESTNSKDRARYRAQYSSETGFLENSAFRVQTADPFSENGRPSRTGASQPNHQHIAANLFREGAAGLGHSPMRTTRNATFQVKEEDLQGSDLKAPKKPTLQPLSMTLSSLNPHGSSNFQYQPRPARNLFYGSCEPNFLFAEGGNSLLNNRAPQQSPNPAEMDLRGFTNHDAIGMGLLGPSSGMYGLGFPMSDSTFGNLGPQPYFFMPEPATDRLGPSFRMLGQSPIKLEGYGAGDPMLQTPQKRKPSQIKLSDGYNQDFDDDRDFFRAYPDEVQSRMFSAEKTNPNTGYYGRQPNMHPPSMAGGHATQIGFGFHEHTKIRSAYMTVGGMQTHMERGPNHPDHLHQTPRNNRDLHGNGHGGYYPKGSQLADLDTTGTMKKRRIMHSTELTGASQRSPSDQESRFGSRRVSRTYYGLGLKGTSLDHLNSTKKRLNLDGNSAQQQKYNRNAYLQNDPNNNETSNQMSSDQGSAARMYTGANTRNRTKKLAVEQVPSTSEHEQTRHRKNGVKWNKVSEPVEPILSNQGNKGLKLLSHRVKEIVAQRRKTTYKEVAEILIHESKYISYMNSEEDSGHPQRTHERNTLSSREEQNIKRRVYDALNVLIAAEVLLKEGKSVYYKLYCTNSLVTPSSQRVNSLTRANGMGAPNTSNTLGASHCSPGQVAQGFGGLYQCKTAVELLQKRDKLSRYYQQRLAELNTKRAELADKSGKLCVLLDILERNKESPMKPQQNTMLVQFPFVMVKVDSQQTDPSDPNSFITICQNNQQRNKLGFRCNTKLILIEDMNIIFPLSAYFNSREEIVDRLRRYVAKDEAMLLQHVLLRDT